MILRFRTRNGLGISSVSGSHTVGGLLSLFFSAIRAAKALPFGSGLLVPSEISTGLPPALAWASSTSVRPRGARFVGPPLLAFAMLFFAAILLRSSFFFVKLVFRVGDVGIFSWPERVVELGILDSRLFGEVVRSLKAALLT